MSFRFTVRFWILNKGEWINLFRKTSWCHINLWSLHIPAEISTHSHMHTFKCHTPTYNKHTYRNVTHRPSIKMSIIFPLPLTVNLLIHWYAFHSLFVFPSWIKVSYTCVFYKWMLLESNIMPIRPFFDPHWWLSPLIFHYLMKPQELRTWRVFLNNIVSFLRLTSSNQRNNYSLTLLLLIFWLDSQVSAWTIMATICCSISSQLVSSYSLKNTFFWFYMSICVFGF